MIRDCGTRPGFFFFSPPQKFTCFRKSAGRGGDGGVGHPPKKSFTFPSGGALKEISQKGQKKPLGKQSNYLEVGMASAAFLQPSSG